MDGSILQFDTITPPDSFSAINESIKRFSISFHVPRFIEGWVIRPGIYYRSSRFIVSQQGAWTMSTNSLLVYDIGFGDETE